MGFMRFITVSLQRESNLNLGTMYHPKDKISVTWIDIFQPELQLSAPH